MNNINKGWLDILIILKREAEAISGEWNGDEDGREEDRAHIADEISETVSKLLDLLSEMDEYDN
jgi:hypothetical protein